MVQWYSVRDGHCRDLGAFGFQDRYLTVQITGHMPKTVLHGCCISQWRPCSCFSSQPMVQGVIKFVATAKARDAQGCVGICLVVRPTSDCTAYAPRLCHNEPSPLSYKWQRPCCIQSNKLAGRLLLAEFSQEKSRPELSALQL